MTHGGEQDELGQVVDRLTVRFPQVAIGDIDATVRQHLHRFDHAAVRDFVPVLVERGAASDLRAYA